MNPDTYKTLLADLCAEVGGDVARLAEDGRLLVDGTEMSLAHDRGIDGEHLWICIDFGAIPRRHAGRVYRAMLQANLRAGSLELGVFSLQRGDRAAFVVRQPLDARLTGRQLSRALMQYAAAAKRWVASVCAATEAGGRSA